MRFSRILVAGTGTAVGKTTFTCALQRALHTLAVPTLALKPVETGYSDEDSDAARIHLGTAPHPRPLYAFRDPVSPHLAAEGEGGAIEVAAIRDWVEQHEDEWRSALAPALESAVSIVELAGGLFTPLSLLQTNADLLPALAPCVLVLVANDRLGVLHDLGACLRALQAFHRRPDLVVFSRATPDHSTAQNSVQFRRLFPGVLCCTLDLELDGELAHNLLRLSQLEPSDA